MSSCKNHDHKCEVQNSSVMQTIDEMDWERGIWNAALYGDTAKVIEFLERGVDVSVRDGAGYTALHYAARAGHTSICKALLTRGADVNAATKSGQVTSLHRASSAGHVEIVKLLLKFGADLRRRDSDGQTALHRAAEFGRRDVIQLLVQESPQALHDIDAKGRKPLDCLKNGSDDYKALFN